MQNKRAHKNEAVYQLVRNVILKKLIVLASCVLVTGVVYANPEGGVVTSGTADIVQSSGHTQINQASDTAIINWHSFNIGSQEATHFQQPSASSITLNRINPGQGVSEIYGSLTSNGRIILVNQAGIYFGPGARVDVGGIIASTSDITDQNFLAGKYIFDQPSAQHGTIINQGTIIAANHGLVALIGANVSNEGYIQANVGNVVLASGNKFTVDLAGDGLVSFAIDEESSGSGFDHQGKKMQDGVRNSGKIVANGGTITLAARNAQGIVDHAINMDGVAVAHSVKKRHGEIILSANGNVKVSGKLIATGKHHKSGGKVKIFAPTIHIASPALIDVSGGIGGGEILIGGDTRGAGSQQNAMHTIVDDGVLLKADAKYNGNGGKIIVWSDDITEFHGSASAKGGVYGGNGGFIETSGKYLNVNRAQITTYAYHGQSGTWLLDPLDIIIDSADNNVTSSSPFTPTGTASTIDVATIRAALLSGSVVIDTTGTSGPENGDITVNSDIVLPLGGIGNLTLNAAGNIYINANIIMGNASNQNRNLTLNALNGSISDVSAKYLGAYDITMTAQTISFTQGSTIQAFGDLSLGGGTLTMTATSASSSAIDLANTILDTQSAGTTGSVILQTTDPNGGISLNSVNACTGGNPCNVSISTPQLTIGTGGFNFGSSYGTQSITMSGSGVVNFYGNINGGSAPTLSTSGVQNVYVTDTASLTQAASLLQANGNLFVTAGDYLETVTINTPITISVYGGGVVSAQNYNFNAPVSISGDWFVFKLGNFTFNQDVTLAGSTVLDAGGASANIDFYGKLNGPYSLTIDNLSDSANFYDVVGGITSLGQLTINGYIGNGTVNIYNNIATAGDQNINVDTINVSNMSGITLTGGSINLTASSISGSDDFTINNSSTSTIQASLDSFNSFTKDGSGTLNLTSPSTYTTLTTINNGVLNVTDNSALGTSTVTVNSSGTLQVTDAYIDNVTTLNGGTLIGVGDTQVLQVELTADSIITVANASDYLTIPLIEGSSGVTLTGSGTIELQDVGTGNTSIGSIISNVDNLILNAGFDSTGSQIYNGTLTLNDSLSFSVNGTGDIYLNNLVGNGYDLYFANYGDSANTINVSSGSTQTWDIGATNYAMIADIPGLNSLIVDGFANIAGGANIDIFNLDGGTISGSINGGGGADNTIAVTDGSDAIFNVSGLNSGSVTTTVNSFSNIQSFSGGSGSNQFIFTGSGTSTGFLDGGVGTSSLDLSGITGNVDAQMSADHAGVAYLGSNPLVAFDNIGSIVVPTITLANKANTVYITAYGIGYINDPLNFSGVTTFNGGSGTQIIFDTGYEVNYNSGTNSAAFTGGSMQFAGIPAGAFSSTFVPLPSSNGSTPTITPAQSPIVTNVITQAIINLPVGSPTASSGSSDSNSDSSADSDNANAAVLDVSLPAVIVNQNISTLQQNQQQLDTQLKDNQKIGCVR